MSLDMNTSHQINQNIWKNLIRIQSAKKFSDEKMCELLGSRVGDFKLNRDKKRSPPLLALVRLSRHLKIDLSQIYFSLPEDFEKNQ